MVDHTNEPDLARMDLPMDTQAILTVGGDGTLIDAAQKTLGMGIPLLGINRGHLGYLCDLDDDSAISAIELLMQDDFGIEERMMISGTLRNAAGEVISESYALNDIVISSKGGLNIIDLTVYVNGKYLYSYPCDGMIFSTPTGSTAYNLSANGPIVNPKTKVILLTPINPHTLNSRPIVLDQDDMLTVEIKRRHLDMDERAEIAYDGGHKIDLAASDSIMVKRTTETMKMIRLNEVNFLERIRTKLQAN